MAEGFLINLIFGFAVNMIMSALFKQDTMSNSNTPLYSDQLQTTISNTIPIPMIYGTVKQAGNLIYQELNSDKTVCSKLVCFGYGPIKDISDVRINDLVVGSSTTNYSTAMFIWNNTYSDSTVSISGNVLYCANKAGSFSLTISDKTFDLLVTRIQEFGAGWQASNQGLEDKDSNSLNNLAKTSCFNVPVALKVSSSDSVYSASGYRKYLGNGVQEIDAIAPGSTQLEKAKNVGGLKWDAYLAIWATASEQINGDYNVTALVHGRIVKIYKTINSYYYEWSDNPAWCILDFLTSHNGVGLDYDQIDIQSFIDAANYCDQLVTNLDGTKQKRFSLNLVIGEQKSRLDWLADMMRTCQAFPTYQNGKYGIIVEQPVETSQCFNGSNMNDLEIWWSPMDEIVDILRVKYVDPSYDWAKIMAFSEAEKYLRDFPYTYDVEILGITNFSQASRIAWFYQNQSQTCTTWCKFKTDRRAISRSIGDVISITDYIVEWENKLFRVMKMNEAEEDKIEVTCREYNPNIYSDAFGSVEPVVNHTKLANPFDKPPGVSFGEIAQDYYILPNKRGTVATITAKIIPPTSYSAYKQFRYWYSNDSGKTWNFGGITTETTIKLNNMEIGKTYQLKVCLENFYGVLSDFTYSDLIYFSGKNAAPQVVSGFKAVETVGGFTLQWDASSEPDLDYYSIFLNNTDNEVSRVTGNSLFYPAKAGNYVFFIRAVDTAGNKSEIVSAVGAISSPSQVQGFNAYQSGSDIMFVWEQNKGESVYYEIRRGSEWDVSVVVARATGNFAKLQFASVGSHKFWIKAKSLYGVYCESATWATLDIAQLPNRNIIYTETPLPLWKEFKQNVEIVGGGLQLQKGKSRGEYIHNINLPYSCTSRNWIDSSILSVVSGGIPWQDASFRWQDSKADSPWLSKGQGDASINVYQQISIKGSLPSSCLEAIHLSESTTGEKGATPSEEIGISYANARFKKGAYIKDSSFLKYDNLNVPAVFSFSQTITLTEKPVGDLAFYTLKNSSGGWLLLEYIKSLDEFVLRGSDGKDISLYIEKEDVDFVTIVISQSSTTRSLIGYSASSDRKVSSSVSATPIGVFTSLALYANI